LCHEGLLDEEQEEKQPRLSDALSQVAELAHLAMSGCQHKELPFAAASQHTWSVC